jgi:hypothetical protein
VFPSKFKFRGVFVCVCALFTLMSGCVKLEKARQRRIRDNDRQKYIKAAITQQKEEQRAQLRRELRQLKAKEDIEEATDLHFKTRPDGKRDTCLFLVCFVLLVLTANLLFWQYIITRQV